MAIPCFPDFIKKITSPVVIIVHNKRIECKNGLLAYSDIGFQGLEIGNIYAEDNKIMIELSAIADKPELYYENTFF